MITSPKNDGDGPTDETSGGEPATSSASSAAGSTSAEQSPLTTLTQELEQVDKLLIKLITRRLALLNRIHEHKEALNYPLFQKEEEVNLKGRIMQQAERFGVKAELIERVFRHISDESFRRHMSDRRKTVPQEARRTIAIIGGTGGMGRFFARLFAERGHEVLIASEATELRPEDAAARADLVILSVPIAVTQEVIKQVAPHVRPGCCLMDVTSLKSGPLAAMLESAGPDVEVIGTHPMFGPTVQSLLRQVVVLCPGRGDNWLPWLRQFLESQGAVVKMTTPLHHDKMMSVIQVLRHFISIAMGKCLESLDVDIEESLEFTSPIYRLELAMIGRIFAQNAALYADIEMQNPLTSRVVATFLHSASIMAGVVVGGDREAFIDHFERTAQWFGPFRKSAMDESDYLITKLVERLAG